MWNNWTVLHEISKNQLQVLLKDNRVIGPNLMYVIQKKWQNMQHLESQELAKDQAVPEIMFLASASTLSV